MRPREGLDDRNRNRGGGVPGDDGRRMACRWMAAWVGLVGRLHRGRRAGHLWCARRIFKSRDARHEMLRRAKVKVCSRRSAGRCGGGNSDFTSEPLAERGPSPSRPKEVEAGEKPLGAEGNESRYNKRSDRWQRVAQLARRINVHFGEMPQIVKERSPLILRDAGVTGAVVG